MPSRRVDEGYGVHFFKVILENNIRDGQLRVPKSFVRRHWQEMSTSLVLRLPNGSEWRVYWLKSDGDVWLRNGWKEFAESMSLEASQFLVFRYEGKSRFSVIVLGKCGLEIKYPSSSKENDINEEEKEDEKANYESDDCSLEILHGRMKRPRDPSSSSQARKKVKRSPKEELFDAEANHGKKKAYVGFDGAMPIKTELSEQRIKEFNERVKSSFYSDKAFFACSLRKTYTERDILAIPNDFAKPIQHMEGANAILFLDHKRTWDVKLKQWSRQLTFSSGWKKFLGDNNLKFGDVCVFELHKVAKEVSFRAHIYRFREEWSTSPHFADQEGPNSHRPSSSTRSHKTPKANSRFMSTHPHFIIHIKHNITSSHFAVIPIEFMRKNLIEESGKYATLRVGKRSWRVKVLYYPTNSSARFSHGWPEFVKDCNLEEGDSCLFELTNKDNIEFQVSITRRKLS